MDDHARECASCRKRLGDGYGIEVALLSDTEHLAYEQMEAYVDGTLPPIQVDEVRRHVSVCQTCEQELLDLENFRQRMQHPGAMPADRPRLWQRRAPQLRQAAAVAVLGLIGLLIYMWQTSGRPSDSPVSSDESQLAADIAALPASVRFAVAKAIESSKVDLPAEIAKLRGQAQTLRGSSDSGARFAVLAPVGEAVSEARPTFHWQPLQGTSSYSVAIFDEGLNVVQSSPRLYTTHWQAAEPGYACWLLKAQCPLKAAFLWLPMARSSAQSASPAIPVTMTVFAQPLEPQLLNKPRNWLNIKEHCDLFREPAFPI